MFVGNEYNLPWIGCRDKREFLRDVGADWVGTQLPLEAGEWLYGDTGGCGARRAACRQRACVSPRQAG